MHLHWCQHNFVKSRNPHFFYKANRHHTVGIPKYSLIYFISKYSSSLEEHLKKQDSVKKGFVCLWLNCIKHFSTPSIVILNGTYHTVVVFISVPLWAEIASTTITGILKFTFDTLNVFHDFQMSLLFTISHFFYETQHFLFISLA